MAGNERMEFFFPLRAGMRALVQGLVASHSPAVSRDVTGRRARLQPPLLQATRYFSSGVGGGALAGAHVDSVTRLRRPLTLRVNTFFKRLALISVCTPNTIGRESLLTH